MIDYLSEIKRALLKKLFIFFVIFYLTTALFLFLILKTYSPGFIFKYELVYLIISLISFAVLRSLLGKFMRDKFGSQEPISRSIFKNTRTIINNISHELRTPLNAIMGFSASLYETEENPEKKQALFAIKENSDRLFSMAKKLIDFSSIETGQYILENEYIHNESLLTNLENKFSDEAKLKGLALHIINEIPDDLGIFIDFNALFEILEMLVENAIKFTDRGSVTVKSFFEKGILNYVISDTGSGVPDSKKELIFQLYRQGNSELDREYDGLGLGLTIAEKLTHMLGGTIHLTDNNDHGTCFNIQIKTEFRKRTYDEKKDSETSLPIDLNVSDKVIIGTYAEKMAEHIKVFDPVKIRQIAEDLVAENQNFKDLSDRIIRIADTYNESEFSLIIEEMKKGTVDGH